MLIEREKRRIKRGEARHTQDEVWVHLKSVQDDLVPTEPHHQVHDVLCVAMLDNARLASWQIELGLQ